MKQNVRHTSLLGGCVGGAWTRLLLVTVPRLREQIEVGQTLNPAQIHRLQHQVAAENIAIRQLIWEHLADILKVAFP
jgi:hypothetical protein